MRKLVSFLLALTLVLGAFSLSYGANISFGLEKLEETVRPGKAYILVFYAPEDGTATISLKQGVRTVQLVADGISVTQGMNRIWWNGTKDGNIPEPGEYQMELKQGSQTAVQSVTIGTVAPFLSGIQTSGIVTPENPLTVTFEASVDGTVTTGFWKDDVWTMLENADVDAGENTVTWAPAGVFDGEYSFTVTLTDILGYPSNEEHIPVVLSSFGAAPSPSLEPAPTEEPPALDEVTEEITEEMPEEGVEVVLEEPVEGEIQGEMVMTEDVVYTPSFSSPYTSDTSMNYWTLPMDITDEDRVWEMLMQPMTVLSGDEKSQTVIRSEPDSQSPGVGYVTQETQGVHVISQTDDGWSLIECYSSSFYGSKIKAWNMLVQGYVKTSQLKTVKPQSDYAIVVDKLTQRLYLFKGGKLYSTLLVSTGLTNAKQPFNETRSGEFVLTSAVGDFRSDNMTCGMALRFNSGDLLHEVPSIANKDGSKNYGYTEPKLGEKASHGCIRVQRAKTPEGINMSWLWKNRARNTKIVIWEDWQGRQIATPPDDFTVYYNPNGGRYYHSQEKCSSAVDKVFTPLTYGELCDNPEFTGLKTCTSCAPVLRREKIAEINDTYAPGGDHDPVMTEAREKAGY